MIAVFALLAIAAGVGCGLAWWRGYEQGFRAATAYRRLTAEVEAGTLPVLDTPDDGPA